MTLSRRMVLLGGAAVAAIGIGAGLMLNTPAEAAIETGAPAPAFSVVDAAGQTRTLAEFAGRTVVLEWTNHGCPYVQKHYNAGAMQSVQRDAMADGVVWLTVISSAPGEQGHLDGAGARAQATTWNSEPSAILLDPSGAMGRAYDARTTPHMYIINPEGRLVYQGAIDDRPSSRASSLEGAANYVRAALEDLEAGRPVRTAQTTPYGCNVKYRG